MACGIHHSCFRLVALVHFSYFCLFVQHVQLLTQTIVQSHPVSDELLMNTQHSATMMLVFMFAFSHSRWFVILI